jgi:hypothetical protein
VRRKVAELMTEAQEYELVEAQAGRPAADDLFYSRYVGGHAPPFGVTIPWQTGLDRIAQQMLAHLEAAIDSHAGRIALDMPYEPQSPGEFYRKPMPDHDATRDGQSLGSLGGTLGWPDEPVLDGGLRPQAAFDGDQSVGAVPGDGGGWAGERSFVDTPAGRVLPPGGVIGAPGPATSVPPGGLGSARPTGGSGMVPMVPPLGPSQPGSLASSASPPGKRARRGLPSVFQVPEGPPAVLLPSQEPTVHDPGPGVIGIDQ